MERQLEAQSPQYQITLSDTPLPAEIIPFVKAMNRLLLRIPELLGGQCSCIDDVAHP